uniref:Uncharacterized protein n=1 Tax=Leersia perrieri TaxID=77586 RepID=A0A0D9XC03_9ORYZ
MRAGWSHGSTPAPTTTKSTSGSPSSNYLQYGLLDLKPEGARRSRQPDPARTYAQGLQSLGPTRRAPRGVGLRVRQEGHTPQKGFGPPEATWHAPEEGASGGLRGGHIPQKGFGPPETTWHAPEEGTPRGLWGGKGSRPSEATWHVPEEGA